MLVTLSWLEAKQILWETMELKETDSKRHKTIQALANSMCWCPVGGGTELQNK